MATFSKIPLSGSTNGKGIQVAATSTPGTTIHTAVSGTTDFDELWIYAVNISESSVKLTIEYGGTAGADNVEITIPGEAGLTLVIPGLFLNNAQVVTAFAATTNTITLHGYVNRVS
jgi:hypothetical protein